MGSRVGYRNPGEQRITQNDHALDQVLQLPNVAGIALLGQPRHHGGRDRKSLAPEDLRVSLHEVVDEDGDFLGALPQGRDGDLNDVEAVVKNLAEATFRAGTLAGLAS